MYKKNSNIFVPISGRYIKNYIKDATILKYSELKNYSELPELPLILLYEIKPNIGHWVTVIKTPEGIEHFDSYGYEPDGEFIFIPDDMKEKYKYLVNLLINTGEQINYNNYKLQDEPPIATCGRWCILRNLLSNLTTDQFNRVVTIVSKKFNISNDEMVSIII